MTPLLWLSVASAEDPAPSAGPTVQEVTGTWYVTSMIDGKEAVAWSCKLHPDTFEFDSGHLLLSVGAQSYGGAVTSSTPRGAALVLTTGIEACSAPREISVKWADPSHKIVEVTRCTGSPRTVRAVRDLGAQVPVLRQCCDPSGKAIQYVGIDAPCPAGSEGQRPTPLRR
jgi:hypothetical protein